MFNTAIVEMFKILTLLGTGSKIYIKWGGVSKFLVQKIMKPYTPK